MQILQLTVPQSFSPTGGALRDETKTASGVACSGLSVSGEDAEKEEKKKKDAKKVGGAGKRKGFNFVFALSQFSGPDYLGAWNRLLGGRLCKQGLRYCLPQLLFKAASRQFHFAWNDVTYRGKRPRPKMQYIFYNLYQGELCLVSITTPLIRV